ncbi:hypothetical protein [Plantactinospora sp. CA-290183]|uniref:hypothetical protein n=1 Tax=Plantactinospora sp. CA-290183 TaxID=3240006 RepID=UPI003D8B5872
MLLPALVVVLVLLALTVAMNVAEEMTVRRHNLGHLWRFGPTVPGAPEPNVPPSSEIDPGTGAARPPAAGRTAETGPEPDGPAVGG